MELYRRMLGFARPYWSWLLGAVLCAAAAAGLETASMYLIKMVMDDGFLNQDPAAARRMLTWLPLGIIAVMILKGAFTYAADVLNNAASNRVIGDLRNRLFDQLMRLPLAWHHRERVGNLTSRATHDVEVMQSGVSDVVGRVVGSGLKLMSLTGLVIYLNWQFALKAMVGVPLAMAPLRDVGSSIRKLSYRDQERFADLNRARSFRLVFFPIVQDLIRLRVSRPDLWVQILLAIR